MTDPLREPGSGAVPRAEGEPALLNRLVERCTDEWDARGPAIVDEICARHPAHAAALRRRIELLRRSGLLPVAASGAVRRLGDFRLDAELGAGGMGVIYLATQESLGRQVALKVIRPEQSFFAAARQRFLREAEAVARLQHPGIVPIHVVGEQDGVLYYAMERVVGCTLAAALAKLQGRDPGTLTGADLRGAILAAMREPSPAASGGELFAPTWAESCLRLAQRVCDALEHAHGRGVLHRDVKPSNVMLTPDGRVLLLDFGLATAEGDPRITRPGAQVGSLAYMAPEQVRGDHAAIGRHTDVYATGLLLYEALVLAQPFLSDTSERTRQAVLASRPPAPRSLNRALSVDVELVCLKAMDPEPGRRYARAADLARDIDNVLALRPVTARAPSLRLRAVRAARRHPARAASALFTALLLLVVLPASFLQQRASGLALAAEKGRTETALLAEQAARTRAEAQEERARFALGKAREAVDRFLAGIGQFRAVDIPMLEELRRDTLQDALELYEELLADAGAASEELQRDRARTRFSLAQVLRELGRSSEAEPVLVTLLAELDARGPAMDRPARSLRAQALSALGAVRRTLDQPAAAEEPLAQAQRILQELRAEQPSEPLHQLMLRNSVQLAQVRLAQERHDEAAALFGEALAAGTAAGDALDLLRIRADAHDGLGAIASLRSDVTGAIEQHRQAVELHRAIVARAPAAARFRAELAKALESLSLVLHSWRPAARQQALAHAEETAAIRAALAREFPRQPSHQVDASRSQIMVATLRSELGDPASAEADLRAAVAGLERVRTDIPAERSWRQPLVYACHLLAQVLHAQGRTADAAAESSAALALARAMAADQPADPYAIQQLAEILRARSAWGHAAAEGLAPAREAFAIGLRFLREHPDNARLRGTAYRCFEHLADLLCAGADPLAVLAVADAYRDADCPKWQSQLTLARTYLRAAAMPVAAGDAALQERCRAAAVTAVARAGRHSLREVLRIENDELFAPLLADPRVQELLAQARGAGG